MTSAIEYVRDLIPSGVRRAVYGIIAGVWVALWLVSAFLTATSWGAPDWLGDALAGFGVIAGPLAILAGVNVSRDGAVEPIADDGPRHARE